jgi:hypothetical protein
MGGEKGVDREEVVIFYGGSVVLQISPLRYPGFPFELSALVHFMRLSLRRVAHAGVSGAAWQEIRVRFGRDDKFVAQEAFVVRAGLNSRSATLRSVEKHFQDGASTQRSLHYAPPDFPFRVVALMKFMRLSLRRAASVVVASSAR